MTNPLSIRKSALGIQLDVLDRPDRIVVVNKSLEAFSRGSIPDSTLQIKASAICEEISNLHEHKSIHRAGDNQSAVSIEIDGSDGVRVSGQDHHRFPFQYML